MNKYYTLTLLATISFIAASAQYTRHIVEFKDKNGTQFTLANPSAYLSQRAIDRRTRQGLTIDSTDLPISKTYMDAIRAVPNVTILNVSKWLNQILIQTSDPAALATINSFAFVKSRTAIAPRINFSDGKVKSKIIEGETPVESSKTKSTEEIQLDYGGTGNQIKIHKGEYLHNLGFTGQSIIISILDAGFFAYKTNPALDSVRLQGRILGEWDYVANHASVNEDNSHGANCFSIIASNKPGVIVGSAPHAKFWLLRTENTASEYPVEEQNWAAAAEFSDSAGADMISSSLGYADFDDPTFTHSWLQRDGNTSIVTRAADLAAKKGIIVMNSAGNSGTSSGDLKYIGCPADGDSVVAVGAVDVNGNIASFSSWGPNGAGKLKPNMVSVGQGTVYASSAGNPVAGNGTSYSNPNLAGLMACFWQAFPEMTNMQLIDLAQKSSSKAGAPDIRYGYGIPDFRRAFALALVDRATFSVTANNCVGIVTWQSKDNSTMRYDVQRKFPSDPAFVTIATVNGKTAGFEKNSYTFSDTIKNYVGGVQYRIQQIVTDSAINISVGNINLTGCAGADDRLVTINPNPVKNNVMYVTVNTPEALPNMSVVITNMHGQIMKRWKMSVPVGVSTQPVSLEHVAAGMYVITVYKNSEEIHTQKIIKK